MGCTIKWRAYRDSNVEETEVEWSTCNRTLWNIRKKWIRAQHLGSQKWSVTSNKVLYNPNWLDDWKLTALYTALFSDWLNETKRKQQSGWLLNWWLTKRWLTDILYHWLTQVSIKCLKVRMDGVRHVPCFIGWVPKAMGKCLTVYGLCYVIIIIIIIIIIVVEV